MKIEYDTNRPESDRWTFDPWWTRLVLIAFVVLIFVACVLPVFIHL